MKDLDDVASRFMRLFNGYDGAYYLAEVTGKFSPAGKAITKYRTVRERIQHQTWVDHLHGKLGLLVIPIDKDNNVSWGCIDVDDYTLDHKTLVEKIQRLRLPLIVCRSKSGGCHIFVFTKEPVTASEMKVWLSNVSAGLGISGSEVFPKQSEVLLESGDLGNGLNMPYHEGDKTVRFAIKPNGKRATMVEFLDVAEKARVDPKILSSLTPSAAVDAMPGGPPCLQFLAAQGFPEGSRNNGLMALAVYAKKAFPDEWAKKLEEMNQKLMTPPLSSEEVAEVIKRFEKKSYNYRCGDVPISIHCNSGVCRTRKYGVGSGGSMPTIHSLTKLDTDQPLWFLQVEGGRLELQTEDLQVQARFQRKCMDKLNMMPPRMSEPQWQNLIAGLMAKVQIIQAPVDASVKGHFYDLLESFATDRAQGKHREDMFRGLPYLEDNWIYFRMRDLMDYLNRHKFKDYTVPMVSTRIVDLGGSSGFWKIKGKGLNWHRVPAFERRTEPPEEFKMPGDPI